MANPYYRAGAPKPSNGNAMASRGKAAPVKIVEKPAFPKAGVPGKTQAGNRSAGVPRSKAYVKSEGI